MFVALIKSSIYRVGIFLLYTRRKRETFFGKKFYVLANSESLSSVENSPKLRWNNAKVKREGIT